MKKKQYFSPTIECYGVLPSNCCGTGETSANIPGGTPTDPDKPDPGDGGFIWGDSKWNSSNDWEDEDD